jgi:hypothetical protein
MTALARLLEKLPTWTEARARQQQLRAAGYHVQLTDMGEVVHLIVDGGTRGLDLARVPAQPVPPAAHRPTAKMPSRKGKKS